MIKINKVEISENSCIGLGDFKMGDKVNLLMAYRVIEKTKNYTIIEISSVSLVKTKRRF